MALNVHQQNGVLWGLISSGVEIVRTCFLCSSVAPVNFSDAGSAQRPRLFQATDRDCFKALACGKGGGRSRSRAEVINALCRGRVDLSSGILCKILANLPMLRLRWTQILS